MMKTQEDVKQFLIEEMESGRNLESEGFKNALKECTDDELLYLIAENSPLYSIEEMAAAGIQKEEYRYAMIASSLRGRRALIHDLAVNRELDEALAVRILLLDPDEENKNESLSLISSEALLMLAYRHSVSYREAAEKRLMEIGSSCLCRYYKEMNPEEKEAAVRDWYGQACEYAERLLDLDRKMDEMLSQEVEVLSDFLIGFLACAHPEQAKRTKYACMIDSEKLAAYAGAVTEYPDVRDILSRRIHREDLLDILPYTDSFDKEPFLIRDTFEKRSEFCKEVLRKIDDEEARGFLKTRMEDAGIGIPEELRTS